MIVNCSFSVPPFCAFDTTKYWSLPIVKCSQSIALERDKNFSLHFLSHNLGYIGVNATLTAKVISWQSVTHMCFPGFFTPVLTQIFFPKPPTTFHTSAEVRGENTSERKVATTGNRTYNHQVMTPTRSPLSHPGGAPNLGLNLVL